MMPWNKQHRRESGSTERGQSLIEMTLLMPILILLIIGIVDLGRAYSSYIVITNASREGARYASRFPHHWAGIQNAVQQEVVGTQVGLGWWNTWAENLYGAPGEPIRVFVVDHFPTIMGDIIGLDPIIITASTEMVIFGMQ
jgi:hypothetical protein